MQSLKVTLFSTIQWGLVKSSFPWTLAEWVKEVQDISSQMNATFNHMLHKANDKADGLAKE